MSESVRFNLRVDKALLDRVREEAQKMNISASDFFRMAVVELIEKNDARRNGRITIQSQPGHELLLEEGV